MNRVPDSADRSRIMKIRPQGEVTEDAVEDDGVGILPW